MPQASRRYGLPVIADVRFIGGNKLACEKCKHLVDIEGVSSPHIVRTCEGCGRKIKLREPGDNGHGIKVEKGDQFVFPDGWLQISVNPLKGNSTLTKHGLEWFSKLIIVEDLKHNEDEIESLLEKNETYCDEKLKSSELLKDYDIESPDHSKPIFDLLNKNQSTVEWWAFLFGVFNSIVKEAFEENDARKAAWAMRAAERCRSMCVFKDNLEEVVWMGHSARRIIEVIRKWKGNKENSSEEFWQQIFNENPYVLSQIFSVPVIYIKDKAYVGGMNVNGQDAKFVDYLYTYESSNDALLVELKTPETRLIGAKYRKGVHKPSSEITGSVVQVLDYRRDLSKNIHNIASGTDKEIDFYSPRCVVIAGNYEKELDTELKKKSFELFRSSLKDVEIVTYDELFKKAETLASLFNLVWKEK